MQQITPQDQWNLEQLPPLPELSDDLTKGELLRKVTVATCWIRADMIKTGFNTRKTTRKGVRRMRESLMTRGYVQSTAVVVYPGT